MSKDDSRAEELVTPEALVLALTPGPLSAE
jgi:hypothetical protein